MYEASWNYTKTLWVLKCDIRKFFASIDHLILIEIVNKYVKDHDVIRLLENIVGSFESITKGKGLPLGNLTSQLFANVYMNEFDQYVKHILRQKYYIRYADDFIILHQNRDVLLEILPKINKFLLENLKLMLHPDKVFIKTVASSIDFLGWIHFPDHKVLRTSTKKRMFRKLEMFPENKEMVQSYIGMISHGNTQKLKIHIGNIISS